MKMFLSLYQYAQNNHPSLKVVHGAGGNEFFHSVYICSQLYNSSLNSLNPMSIPGGSLFFLQGNLFHPQKQDENMKQGLLQV